VACQSTGVVVTAEDVAAFDAVVDAEVVGQVLLVGALDGSAEVSRLFVMPSRRGGGIGGRLLAAAVRERSGLPRLTVEG
jgi:GNAT superfamily N-acetyltransferase